MPCQGSELIICLIIGTSRGSRGRYVGLEVCRGVEVGSKVYR